MSLFGTIYLGKSGVWCMSQGIRVSADNVANLESNGFKGSRPLFEDMFLSATTEAPPRDQKGLGTNLEDIEVLYEQEGPIHATDKPTDLAISGRGFFTVTDGEDLFFTRDGNFLVQNAAQEGFLKLSLPNGYDLCGWSIPEGTEGSKVTQGTLSPVVFPSTMAGRETENIELQINCDASKPPESQDISLLDKWDSTNPQEPIAENAYDLKIDLPIFDPAGTKHDLYLYLDRTSQARTFEFLVSLPPDQDWRAQGPFSGCLLSGLLHFGSTGTLESISDVQSIQPDGTTTNLLPQDWSNGVPYFEVNLSGTTQRIQLDFGLHYDSTSNSWQPVSGRQSTAYAAPFSVLYQHLDGYGPGRFQEIQVDEQGVIHAHYTNRQEIQVARIPLALFESPDELSRAGGNLFKSVDGATAQYFAPDKDSIGLIMGGALEGSNVDLANEMVHLITLQRAFQSNTRVISTADQMLDQFLRTL